MLVIAVVISCNLLTCLTTLCFVGAFVPRQRGADSSGRLLGGVLQIPSVMMVHCNTSTRATHRRGLFYLTLQQLSLILLSLTLLLSSSLQSSIAVNAACFTSEELSNFGFTPYARNLQVRIARQGWAGHYLTTAIARILMEEVLGYTVIVNSTSGGGTKTFSNIGTDVVDV
jgi:hypothetical protein